MWLDRQNRRRVVATHTEALLTRMDRAAGTANAKMIWTRSKSLAILESGNHVAADIGAFHEVLEIEAEARSWEPAHLGRAANIGCQAVQKVKDGAPIAGTAAGVVGTGFLLWAKTRDEEST